MVYSYRDLVAKRYNQRSIAKAIKDGWLFKLDTGLYSDVSPYEKNEVYISKKYPKCVLTGHSAFYVYGLTDVAPEKFYLASKQHSFPIKDEMIIQYYQEDNLEVGAIFFPISGGQIRIYNLERLLIELFRLKKKYPPELYYEVLSAFRDRKDELDIYLINQYLTKFRNGAKILEKIKECVL